MTENPEAEGIRPDDTGDRSSPAEVLAKLVMTAAPFVALLALLMMHRCLST